VSPDASNPSAAWNAWEWRFGTPVIASTLWHPAARASSKNVS
jgi:hypothetical protein